METKGLKIILGDEWLEQLIIQINKNNFLSDSLPNDYKQRCLNRNNAILDKLARYKKTDAELGAYYYFFPSELRDLFQIMLENSMVILQKDIDRTLSSSQKIPNYSSEYYDEN